MLELLRVCMFVPRFSFGRNVPFRQQTRGRARQANSSGHIKQLRMLLFDDVVPQCPLLGRRQERRSIGTFLSWARLQGADQGYIARHRKAWWAVGLRAPAPILCTYMARRPPQFTLNSCDARHINVAHGLYPREHLAVDVLGELVAWLNQNINTGSGRTYAGGLTKFEPKEIERLRIPSLTSLRA